MGTPNYPRDMATEWQKLKRDVKNTFTSANTRPGTQSIGTRVVDIFTGLVLHAGAFFRALYSNETEAVLIGRHKDSLGNEVEGLVIRRPNGSTVLWAFGTADTGDAFWAMYDKNTNIIFSDDAASGTGIARPWLPYTFVRTNAILNPTDTTTSLVYVSHHTIEGYMQHPRITITAYIRGQNATTDVGQIQLMNPTTGNVLGTSITTANDFVTITAEHDEYMFGAQFTYDIQIKKVSGSGNVGCTLISAYGIQSP